MIMRTVDCVTKFGSYCPDPDHHQLPPAMMSLALKCPLHNLGLFVILYWVLDLCAVGLKTCKLSVYDQPILAKCAIILIIFLA